MKRNRQKNRSDNSLVVLIFVFVFVVLLCIGIIMGVIMITGNEKTLHAPQTPTPYAYQTKAPTESPPAETPSAAPETPSAEVTREPERIEFLSITASSTREPHKDDNVYIIYAPKNAADNDERTAWTPDESDSQPWIMFESDVRHVVSGIVFENGYSKSEDLYYKNMRAKDISITCGDEEYCYTLKDSGRGVRQSIEFPKPIKTNSIKITIKSTYAGNKFKELCISEIIPF